MNMRYRLLNLWSLASAIVLLPPSTLALSENATWSKESISLVATSRGDRRLRVLSRDKKRSLVVDGAGISILENGKKIPGIEDEGVESLAEVSWAPDSKALFITWSDGGEIGTWRVSTYFVDPGKVRKGDPTNQVKTSFKKQYACERSEEPNIAAIKWVKDSKSLLVVAEAPPHSSCPKMGNVRGYIIDVPGGQISDQFDQTRLKNTWGRYLGSRLKDR